MAAKWRGEGIPAYHQKCQEPVITVVQSQDSWKTRLPSVWEGEEPRHIPCCAWPASCEPRRVFDWISTEEQVCSETTRQRIGEDGQHVSACMGQSCHAQGVSASMVAMTHAQMCPAVVAPQPHFLDHLKGFLIQDGNGSWSRTRMAKCLVWMAFWHLLRLFPCLLLGPCTYTLLRWNVCLPRMVIQRLHGVLFNPSAGPGSVAVHLKSGKAIIQSSSLEGKLRMEKFDWYYIENFGGGNCRGTQNRNVNSLCSCAASWTSRPTTISENWTWQSRQEWVHNSWRIFYLWHHIFGEPWSAVTAMSKLELDIIGLPAARLPAEPLLPHALTGWECLARGGPSFQSCAALWKKCKQVQFHGVGWRRLKLSNLGPRELDGNLAIAMAFVAMPASNLSQEWLQEMKGLTHDMEILQSTGYSLFFISGDLNVQPGFLGGSDPKPETDSAVSVWVNKFSLSILNPTLSGDSPWPVQLPIRQKEVQVNTGDTHHGAGQSRAIDLAFCSSQLNGHCTIHNGRHCAQTASCPWSLCADFCKSDHFLLDSTLLISSKDAAVTTSTQSGQEHFPVQWHFVCKMVAGFSCYYTSTWSCWLANFGFHTRLWKWWFQEMCCCKRMSAMDFGQFVLDPVVFKFCCERWAGAPRFTWERTQNRFFT